MLAISRREGETVVVDGPCTIVVLEIAGARTRLGIKAEPEVKILRGEIATEDAARRHARRKELLSELKELEGI